MARIRTSIVSVFLMLQCAGVSVAADVVTPPHAPHAPSAFWMGLATLMGIGAMRVVRRQWALLRS